MRLSPNIPYPDRVRLRVCWGNSEGPHTHDVPLEPLFPRSIRPGSARSLSIWQTPPSAPISAVFKRYPLPDSMLFLPDEKLIRPEELVEHPEVVADRLCQAVDAQWGIGAG